MDPPKNPSDESAINSSPDVLSPGGRSRYGRNRRPKISQDFYNTDDVIIDEDPPPRHSPIKSPKLKPPPKSPIIPREIVFDIKDEFTKLDDLGMKVANNFKTNLHRGHDDSIKERKFFKSLPENKQDMSNVVDVTKVFKLISAKPPVSELCETRTPAKTALKTYSNKRKHLHDSDSFIVESFGLPDEPIVPVKSPLSVERNTKIDIDASCEVDVNLANPWSFEEFDPVPLYASEPVVEDFHFRGGALDLFSCDSLLGENTNIDKVLDITSNCQSTNFEKSRIPAPAVPLNKSDSKVKYDKSAKIRNQGIVSLENLKSKRVLRSKIATEKQNKNEEKDEAIAEKGAGESVQSPKHCKVVEKNITKVLSKKGNEAEKKTVVSTPVEANVTNDIQVTDCSDKESQSSVTSLESPQLVKGTKKNSTKVLNKKISPLKKKRKLNDSPSRILRSSIDNNNEVKKDISLSSPEDSQLTDNSTAKNFLKTPLKCEDLVINPSKLSQNICSPQVRVILNPLACMHKILETKHLVPNPFKIKPGSKPQLKRRKLKSKETKKESITEALLRGNKRALKKFDKGHLKKSQDEETDVRNEEFDVKNIKTEPIEFQVGDLAWAKIGTHPYWPCMITQEPISGDHKRCIVNRNQPLYHVRFFGDKGRRSWVSAQHVMLYYGRDDLEKLAKVLKAEGKVKAFFIKESYTVRPTKLTKWQNGVDEAESLKSKSVQERLNFFLEIFARRRQKKQLKEVEIKKDLEENVKVEEECSKRKKSISVSEDVNLTKKMKIDSVEIKPEILVKEESPEDKNEDDKVEPNISSIWQDGGFEESPRKKSGIKKIASPEKQRKVEEEIEPEIKIASDTRKKLRSHCNQETLTNPEIAETTMKKIDAIEDIAMRSPEQPKRLKKKSLSVTKEEIAAELSRTNLEQRKKLRKKSLSSSKEEGLENDETKEKSTEQSKKAGKKSDFEENHLDLSRKSDTTKANKSTEMRKKLRRRNLAEGEIIDADLFVASPERSKKVGKKSLSNEDNLQDIHSDLSEKIEPNKEKKISDVRKSLRSRSLAEGEISDDDLPLSLRIGILEKKREDTPNSITKKPPEETNEGTPLPEARKKFLKKEEFSEESLEARKKLRNFLKIETTEVPQEEPKETPDVPKVPKRNSIEEISSQETEEKEPKLLRNKRHQIGGEYSNSDTDSKFSDNSSVPTSMESQAALYRRNNIFRGVGKEKVCQICEGGGEVFKCKGPCSGVYHYKCAMNREDEVKKEEEKEKIEGEVEGKSNVEIVAVDSKKPLPNLGDSPNYKGMSLAEKIDFRMKEIMKNFDYQSVYAESTDSSSEEFVMEESLLKSPSKLSITVTNKPTKKEVPIIKHVTADHISYICVTNEKPKEKDDSETVKDSLKHLKCIWCTTEETPRCLICNKEESKAGSKFRQKCSLHQCGKYYHPECLKMWPQTQWSLIQSTKDKKSDAMYDTFVCPRHVCHTCISDDPRAANSRCPSDKVVKCLRCPATYHISSYCVPAGTHILNTSQIVCPRHYSNQKSVKKKMQQTINTNWCFICSKGGNLICCETCPTSVHVECLPGDLNEDDTFFCEDCQSGRLPLYDEIVWVKLGTFRWWPALILFPNEVPDNVRNIAHNRGEFVVKFFGTYDHYWVGRGRTFLFQEGDKGHSNTVRKRVDNAFAKAIEEAAAAHQLKKQFKLNKVAEKNSGLKPPPYIRIKVNKPVGNVRLFDGNISNTTSCDCDPNQPHPCGPDSDCLNRLLLTECNPQVCPAGDRCNNQCFEKREYPPLVPHRTQVRGWGLKTLAPIRKGQFVIEYVGEIIDEQEYQRRIQKMHEQKEENYYFLTIDKDRTLDAGPKGNVARFMNHSCNPNCETQKWTVNGDTRVGLFAKCDIPADTELTFNYNLECIGKEKKICKCGAPNCSGFIGVKVKTEGPVKKPSKPRKKKSPPPEIVDNENPCFICGKVGDVGACNNKICTKYYHLRCVGLESWPEGGKWVCQWHNCNICSKRTIRCCIKCVNSYCPSHSEGNVRYDKVLPGFICFVHDPTKESNVIVKTEVESSIPEDDTKKSEVEAKEPEETVKDFEEGAKRPEDEFDDDLESISLNMRLNGCMTSTPMKKSKESSQDESTESGGNVSEAKSQTKKKNKREKKSVAKVDIKSRVKNTANLFNCVEKEVKLTKFTPVRHLRTSRSCTKNLNRTDPDKDLPIRKRNRLRCGNTL